MTTTRTPLDTSVALGEAKLSRLGVQVEAVQALLVRLLQDVVRAEQRIEAADATRLVQVNEELVLAALESRTEAEAASHALALATDSSAKDPLTGLLNRTALLDRFVQAKANTRRRGAQFALMFVDLDGFKQLNDAYGHAFGDQVLRLTAERMQSVVREVDTVSRHGGDEFVILLAELTRPEDALAVATKLVAVIGEEALVDDRRVHISASVGIAIHPDHGEDFDTLLMCADTAMYLTKRQRAGGVAMYDPGSVLRPVPPTTAHESARTATDALHARLRYANEKLILSALSARELQEAAELAQQRQAVFIAKVTEELLDPSAPIRIASTMLGHATAEAPVEPFLPLVQGLVALQLAEIARIADPLVEAAGVDRGSVNLDVRTVDLGAIIRATVDQYRPLLSARTQRLEVSLPMCALEVRGDPVRLEQIIGNLLDNARKHTRDGGRVQLAVSMNAGAMVLTVTDNGLGVAAEMLPYVFEPFVQDIQVLDTDGLGLGIELTVARILARAHGGTLVAFSAGTNRGSQLVLTLPLAEPVNDSMAASADASAASGTDQGS